ncbi:MAG: YjjG family noncanonical pyrimidine nucleotidase [Clostridia bacterium]|nr:YjjG family noncanonical pyrimidine nucleotidase [Clostridia bacterium]
MYDFILTDVDDTLLDFGAAERYALKKTHEINGISFDAEDFLLYKGINLGLWEKFESGEMDMDEVRLKRFVLYFKARGINADAYEFHVRYDEALSEDSTLMDENAAKTLEFLKSRAKIFALSNGVERIQIKRLSSAGLIKYFDGLFISEKIGYRKPEKEFFDYVATHIDGFDKTKALMIGDSVSTDLPAVKFGLKTCMILPKEKIISSPLSPDFRVEKFSDIIEFFK